VARKVRRIERFEFVSGEPAKALEYMGQLVEAQSGWINFLPGIVEDEERPQSPTGLAALFGFGAPGNVMCTWIPAAQDRRRLDAPKLGIMHPRGQRAAPDLQSLGVPIPVAWRIEQDHPRRGLVLCVPFDAPNASVLEWILRAGAALCYARLTGRWQAEVHLPVS